MKVRIHRGARQIGGSVIELESHGERLVLDAGMPLNSESVAQRDLLPDVPGLWAEGDGSLRALLISHPHPDHHGLADLVDPSVPILMGEAAASILAEAAFFVPSARRFPVAGHLRHRETLRLGPFAVTPWLVDHSAFDSYALVVEADGRRLLYTGDVRAHGRKSGLLAALAREVGPVDVLVMEGTRVQVGSDEHSVLTEADVEDACATLFAQAEGMALTFYSPQNVDRLVSLYRAAKRSGRIFVMDLYAASIAAATKRPTIPQAGWEGVRVYVPHSQRRRVIEHEAFDRIDAVRARRISPAEAHPAVLHGGANGRLGSPACSALLPPERDRHKPPSRSDVRRSRKPSHKMSRSEGPARSRRASLRATDGTVRSGFRRALVVGSPRRPRRRSSAT